MNNERSNELIGKWLIKATIENKTPIIIGTGKQSGWVDTEVIKDEHGNFYIPGTSFKGALRHYLEENYELPKDILNLFFGYQDNQALSTFFDLKADKKTVINIRDGVAIDIKTNMAKKGAKYDYEIVEPEHVFVLNMELNLFSGHTDSSEKNLLRLLATIKQILENQNEHFAVGAMTTKGFGVLKLMDFKFVNLNFLNPDDRKIWFEYILQNVDIFKNKSNDPIDYEPFSVKSNKIFSISACFKIKSSLLIGCEPDTNDTADKVPLKSNGKPVLSGASLKGVIRSRAIRIINSLNGNGEELIKETFGWADTDNTNAENKEAKKIKSRLIVKETIIENAEEKLKNGIKINRFTGGTIDSALFNAIMLWSKGQDAVHINLQLKNPKNWEKGLLLLILKDLWTSDLAIGADKARGAGVLIGSKSNITDGEETFELEQKNTHLEISGNKNKLELFVTDFINHLNK